MSSEQKKVEELAQGFRDAIKPKLVINTPRTVSKVLVIIDDYEKNTNLMQEASKIVMSLGAELKIVLLYDPKKAISDLRKSPDKFEQQMQLIEEKREQYLQLEGIKVMIDPRVNNFFKDYANLKKEFGEAMEELKEIKEQHEKLLEEEERNKREQQGEAIEPGEDEKADQDEEIVFERKEGFIQTVYEEKNETPGEDEEASETKLPTPEEQLDEKLAQQKSPEELQKEMFERTINLVDDLTQPLEKGQKSLSEQLISYVKMYDPSMIILPQSLDRALNPDSQNVLSPLTLNIIKEASMDTLILLTGNKFEYPITNIVAFYHASQRQDALESIGITTLTFYTENSNMLIMGVVDQATVNSVKLVNENLSSEEIERQLLSKLRTSLESLKLLKEGMELDYKVVVNFGDISTVLGSYLENFKADLLLIRNSSKHGETTDNVTKEALEAALEKQVNVLLFW